MTLPPVPETFYWTEAPCGIVLRCLPLDAIAPNLFTTRQVAIAFPAGQRAVAAAVGAASLVMLRQVHGRAAVAVRRGDPAPPDDAEGDVLVSEDPDRAIAVRAADCVPILLADSRSGAVAAVHAGWRGTAAGAAGAAVDALRREFGAAPENLVAAIGPSIGPCCYEVGSSVVDAFAAAGHGRDLIDRWFQSPPAAQGRFDSAFAKVRPSIRLDLPGANRDQLLLAGLVESNVHQSGLCTAMNVDVLTSYRVEKERAGRLAGVIRAASRSRG